MTLHAYTDLAQLIDKNIMTALCDRDRYISIEKYFNI